MVFMKLSHALKIVLFLILVLFYTHFSFTQTDRETGSIFGTINDRKTNSPLFGASVNIVGTQKGAMADDDGEYTIDRVPPGTYNIRFSMIGYEILIKTSMTVSPGRGTEISVSLN